MKRSLYKSTSGHRKKESKIEGLVLIRLVLRVIIHKSIQASDIGVDVTWV